MYWFIVVGRALGDDETSVHKFHAENNISAIKHFKAVLTEWGADEVFIDGVVNCGECEPMEEQIP